jgi:phage gp16-like protein
MTAAQAADRRAMLAKIHVAKKQLALTDDSYRDLLRRITGQDSAAALDAGALDKVLAEFRRLGFRAPSRAKARSAKPQVRMIYAVWKDMQPLLRDGGDAALRSFVARQTRTAATPNGVAAPDFLSPAQANRVLEGLKAWKQRLEREP